MALFRFGIRYRSVWRPHVQERFIGPVDRLLAIAGLLMVGTMVAPAAPIHAAGDPPPPSIPLVGTVSPASAVNMLGTSHIVRFTCTNAPPGGGWSTPAPPGCYDITMSARNTTVGAPTYINTATCAGQPLSEPLCPLLGAVPTADNTAVAVINPGAPDIYTITFAGYVPAVCPASPVSNCGTTSPLADFICPPGTAGLTLISAPNGQFPSFAACAFTVQAEKKYLEINQLSFSGGPCGGIVMYSSVQSAFSGPVCTLSATASGVVSVATVQDCATTLSSLAGTSPPTAEYGMGARWLCMGNQLAVIGISDSGLAAAGIPNNLAALSVRVQVTGSGSLIIPPPPTSTCTGVGGAVSSTIPIETPFSICPTGVGTVSVNGCVVLPFNTMAPPCDTLEFTYSGCPTGDVCTSPTGGTCPPGYVAQGSPAAICLTNVPTVEAAIQDAFDSAGVAGPGRPGGNSYMKQLDAVQEDLHLGDSERALLDLESLQCHVTAQSGKEIPDSIAATLRSELSLFSTLIGGPETLPAC